jgi:hypothetical protein
MTDEEFFFMIVVDGFSARRSSFQVIPRWFPSSAHSALAVADLMRVESFLSSLNEICA